MSEEFAKKIGLRNFDLVPADQATVKTAHRHGELEVLGETRRPLQIRFGDCQLAFATKPVVIKDFGMDFNISGPFMKRYNIDQLHSEDALRIGTEKIPLLSPDDGPFAPEKISVTVLLPTTVEVPPYSICHLEAHLATETPIENDMIVLGNDGLLKRGLVPWNNVLVKPIGGKVRLGLCNPGETPVRVKNGTKYGELVQICSVQQQQRLPWRIAVVQPSTSSLIPNKPTVKHKLQEIIEKLKQQAETTGAMSSSTVDISEKQEKRPLTVDQKKKWLIKEFSLDKNKILRDNQSVDKAVALLMAYFDTISVEGEFGHTTLMKHEIHTDDVHPIKCRNRPINPWLEPDLKRQCNDLLNREVIEPSNSPWSFPLVAAPKKNGKIRWCVDYRRLNDITRKDTFPLPQIEDNLARLADAKIFSCLDGSGAFHVLSIREEDRPKTAFSTPWGTFQYKRMPFGLTNGPASYSRLVQLALNGVPHSVALPYLDDIIVLSSTLKEHFANLEQILQIHRTAGLKLQPSKCQLFQPEVEYLGHIVSQEGVKPVADYAKTVSEWPLPQSKSDLRVFLGKVGYYRRFIKGYSALAGPLTEKSGKGTPDEEKAALVITPEMEAAFLSLREKLLTAPILAYPRFGAQEPFILDTDWSQEANAIGGVLSQVQEGKERVIQYGSKKLAKSQKSYAPTKGELVAFLYFAQHWSYYLRFRKFILRTDHQPLVGIRKMSGQDAHTLRMLAVLADFDFEVRYRPGEKHQNADSLSRAPHVAALPDAEQAVAVDDELVLAALATEMDGDQDPVSVLIDRQELRRCQDRDECLRLIKETLRQSSKPPSAQTTSAWPPEARTYLGLWSDLNISSEGILQYRRKNAIYQDGRELVCIPSEMQDQVIKQAHREGGHCGINNTTERLHRIVYFPRMSSEVTDVLKRCEICQKKSGMPKPQRHTLHSSVSGYPFQRISMDYVGPLHGKGMRGSRNVYIFTVRDTFTKWLEAFPTPTNTAAHAVNKLVNEIFTRFGIPEVLHSDQGTHFTARLLTDVARELGIRCSTTPAYNPKSNPVERAHRDLGTMLRASAEEADQPWEKVLPQCVFAINTSLHSSIGMSPYRALFGRDPATPLQLIYGDPNDRELSSVPGRFSAEVQDRFTSTHAYVRKELGAAVERARRQYHGDQKLFVVGQLVWLFTPVIRTGISKKLQTFWTGPWKVVEQLNGLMYRIRADPSWGETKPEQAVSVDRLKPYFAQPDGARKNIPPTSDHDVDMSADEFAERIPGNELPRPDDDEDRPDIHDGDSGSSSSSSDDDDDDMPPAQAVQAQAQEAVGVQPEGVGGNLDQGANQGLDQGNLGQGPDNLGNLDAQGDLGQDLGLGQGLAVAGAHTVPPLVGGDPPGFRTGLPQVRDNLAVAASAGRSQAGGHDDRPVGPNKANRQLWQEELARLEQVTPHAPDLQSQHPCLRTPSPRRSSGALRPPPPPERRTGQEEMNRRHDSDVRRAAARLQMEIDTNRHSPLTSPRWGDAAAVAAGLDLTEHDPNRMSLEWDAGPSHGGRIWRQAVDRRAYADLEPVAEAVELSRQETVDEGNADRDERNRRRREQARRVREDLRAAGRRSERLRRENRQADFYYGPVQTNSAKTKKK